MNGRPSCQRLQQKRFQKAPLCTSELKVVVFSADDPLMRYASVSKVVPPSAEKLPSQNGRATQRHF
jgi:hypothetical protein